MSAFLCPTCNVDMPFDHTDYYDFDVYICPKCSHEIAVPADFYLDDESLMAEYGDDYFDDTDWGGDDE